MNIDVRGRKIAIIGGAGFIGHNLALSLQAKGAQVEVIDSLQVNNLLYFASGHDPANRDLNLRIINQRLELLRAAGVPMHPQDARDYHAISRILDAIKPQVIIHLAAVSHAGKSNKDPYSTFDHSLRTLENALDCARDGSCEHFIFLSSSMAYGNFETEAVDETHPLNPIGIYGALKVAGEKMVIAYQQVFGLPYTILRPSALYGPRCVSRRVIQIFIEAALRGQKLRIDGDGSERLDFTFIDDLVAGLALTIEHPGARNEIFNITYGGSRSVLEVVNLLRREFPGLEVESVERDHLMPFRGTLKVDKAHALLGYRPRYSIEEGIPRYVNWYRELTSEAAVPAAV
jgi:nucleoside-diphosphate-sugar epimerase